MTISASEGGTSGRPSNQRGGLIPFQLENVWIKFGAGEKGQHYGADARG